MATKITIELLDSCWFTCLMKKCPNETLLWQHCLPRDYKVEMSMSSKPKSNSRDKS